MLDRVKQLKRTQYLSVGLIFLPLLVATPVAAQTVGVGDVSYSGDDAYDPAAGGPPALSAAGFVWSSGSEFACAPSAGELEARRSRSVDGGFSGDDAYDRAAGGTPELSLLAIGLDLVACAPTVSVMFPRESGLEDKFRLGPSLPA